MRKIFKKTAMLYDNILGRAAKSEGLKDFVTALNEGRMTPNEVIRALVFSDELKPKISLMGSEEFVTFLYENVFNREPDPNGYARWVDNMKNGMSKEDVLSRFLDCGEFKNICEMFGLKITEGEFFEDINGEDIVQVIYLNNQKGVYGFGHVAMIMVKANDSGIYYSFDPKESYVLKKVEIFSGFGVAGFIDRIGLNQDQMKSFKKDGSGKLPSGYQYTGFLSTPVTKKQGEYMFDEAQRIYNNNNKTYDLYNDNCNHFIQQILSTANLNFTATNGYQFSKWAQLLQEIVAPWLNENIGPTLMELAIKNPNLDKFGTIPNAAYLAGVAQWSAYKGSDDDLYR